jgi:hypothetical protein
VVVVVVMMMCSGWNLLWIVSSCWLCSCFELSDSETSVHFVSTCFNGIGTALLLGLFICYLRICWLSQQLRQYSSNDYMLVNNELGRIWRKAAVDCCKFLSRICVKNWELKKTIRKPQWGYIVNPSLRGRKPTSNAWGIPQPLWLEQQFCTKLEPDFKAIN